MNRIPTLLLLVVSFSQVFAQSKKQAIELRKDALEYYANHDYEHALPLFEKLNSYKPNQSETMYPLAVCLLDYDRGRSLKYFKSCLKDSILLPDRLFAYCGEAYHRHHKMDSALVYFNMYSKKLKSKKANRAVKAELFDIQRQMESCQVGINLMENPVDIEIENLGGALNSKYDEYAPVLSVDEKILIFTSLRPKLIDNHEHLDEDLFISYKQDNGTWTNAVRMGDNVNTLHHDASISISSDGQKLLVYRYAHDNLLHSSGDIFMSELKGSEWTLCEKVHSHINSSSWESSASISADENIIYFTSDRKGGQGGTDIYRVKKLSSGMWAEPENLGDVINTPFNEESPFIHPDGKTLYFSSNGHKTMGGYDIFKSVFNEDLKSWSEPINIGYPINTAHDDLHFQISADGKRLFFASVREESYGGLDIYSAKHESQSSNLLVYKGFVIDSTSHLPIEAKFYVHDPKTNELLGEYNSNSETGKYLIVFNQGKNYELKISSKGFKSKTISVYQSSNEEFIEKEVNFGLQNVSNP